MSRYGCGDCRFGAPLPHIDWNPPLPSSVGCIILLEGRSALSVLQVTSCDNRGQVVPAKKVQLKKCFLLWSARECGHMGPGSLLREVHTPTGCRPGNQTRKQPNGCDRKECSESVYVISFHSFKDRTKSLKRGFRYLILSLSVASQTVFVEMSRDYRLDVT